MHSPESTQAGSQPHLRQLLPRRLKPLALLHELLATLSNTARLLNVLRALREGVLATNTEALPQSLLEPLVTVQPKHELVVDRHGDHVCESLESNCEADQ